MSKTAAQWKDEGNAALSAKKYDEAIAAYTQAIALEPKEHTFYSNRSAAYLSKGDAEDAYQDGCSCVDVNPSWAKGYSRKGAALHAMRDYAAAAAVYQDGLAVAPDDASLKSALAEVQKLKAASETSGGFGGGGGGGLFGPQMLAKLAGHPKFGPKLADPSFMAKLQMMQKNPNLMLQDPEMMEVLQTMLGGMGADLGGEGEDDYPMPPRQSSSSSSNNNASKKREPEPEVELTPEEKEAKAIKDKANAAKERGNALYKEKKFQEVSKTTRNTKQKALINIQTVFCKKIPGHCLLRRSLLNRQHQRSL